MNIKYSYNFPLYFYLCDVLPLFSPILDCYVLTSDQSPFPFIGYVINHLKISIVAPSNQDPRMFSFFALAGDVDKKFFIYLAKNKTKSLIIIL